MILSGRPRWLPIGFTSVAHTFSVRWMDFADQAFIEPFFGQTVDSLRARRPSAEEMSTEISVLLERAGLYAPTTPAGVIFHVSRCGSTLLTNVLKSTANVTALSEAAPIEYFLTPDPFANTLLGVEEKANARRALLNSVIGLYANAQGATPHKIVLKCYPASNLQISAARAMWPHVPFIFLIRDPLEIVLSNLKRPAYWLKSKHRRIRDGQMFGLTAAQIERMSVEEYCARGIASFYKAGIAHIDTQCSVLDYTDMNVGAYYEIAQRFGLQLPSPESEAMQRVLATYSKDATGKRQFVRDNDTKQLDATDIIRGVVEEFARKPYETLLNLRHSR